MAAIVFDLDGTLIDSAPDIHAAANRMLAGEGLDPLDLATITSFIGNGLPKLVERVMRTSGIDPDQHARLSEITLDFYNAAPADLTVIYPGMRAALEQLRASGHVLGLCTNKPEVPARSILDLLGLAGLFDVVIGGDSLPVKKPDPAPLHRAFEGLGQPDRVYVGDSEVDAQTAQNAGAPFILFTQGYRKRPVDELPHAARYEQANALPGLVESVLSA